MLFQLSLTFLDINVFLLHCNITSPHNHVFRACDHMMSRITPVTCSPKIQDKPLTGKTMFAHWQKIMEALQMQKH